MSTATVSTPVTQPSVQDAAATISHETRLQKIENVIKDVAKYATVDTFDTLKATVEVVATTAKSNETGLAKVSGIIGEIAPVASKFGVPDASTIAAVLEFVLSEITSIRTTLGTAAKA